MSKKKLEKYFSKGRIRLAFERYKRVGNSKSFSLCKDHNGIKLFENNLDKNIADLSNMLINNKYLPSKPFKFLFPKKNTGLHRTVTLLNVHDSIVYQCLADIIAYDQYELLSSRSKLSAAHILTDENKEGLGILKNNNTKFYFFEKWQSCWKSHKDENIKIIDQYKKLYVLKSDVSSFYDSISHFVLRDILKEDFSVDSVLLDVLFSCLSMWSGALYEVPDNSGYGLPQGSQPSAFFAELFMFKLDKDISSFPVSAYFRYVDDFKIYHQSPEFLEKILFELDVYLKSLKLNINSSKTKIERLINQREKKKQKEKYEKDEEAYVSLADLINGSLNKVVKKTNPSFFEGQQLHFEYLDLDELEQLGKIDKKTKKSIPDKTIADLESSFDNFLKDYLVKTRNINSKKISLDDADFDIPLFWNQFNSFKYVCGHHKFLNEKLNFNKDHLEFFLNVLKIFPHWYWPILNFLDDFIDKNQVFKKRLWGFYDLIEGAPFIRHFLIYLLLNNFDYSHEELVSIFEKLKNENDVHVKIPFYILLLNHSDSNETQLYQRILTSLIDEKSMHLKYFVVWDLHDRIEDFDLNHHLSILKLN